MPPLFCPLQSAAKRASPASTPRVGQPKPGPITVRTTPADPDAANRPKVAIGPGRYTLDDHVRLIIVGKPVAGRRTSDVEIRFWAADQKSEPPGPPYKIQVPDGFGTWAIACRPRSGIRVKRFRGYVRREILAAAATGEEEVEDAVDASV